MFWNHNGRHRVHVDTVASLPPEDRGPRQSLCRVASQHIDATRRAADKLYRRQAVEIRNPKLGTWVVLDVLGGGQTKGVTASAVALDYDAKVSLGIQGDQEFELVIRPAPWWRVYQYYFKHPDRGTRVGAQLGVLGLGVSIVSFLLGVLTSLVF